MPNNLCTIKGRDESLDNNNEKSSVFSKKSFSNLRSRTSVAEYQHPEHMKHTKMIAIDILKFPNFDVRQAVKEKGKLPEKRRSHLGTGANPWP